jgi:hypothetical protein
MIKLIAAALIALAPTTALAFLARNNLIAAVTAIKPLNIPALCPPGSPDRSEHAGLFLEHGMSHRRIMKSLIVAVSLAIANTAYAKRAEVYGLTVTNDPGGVVTSKYAGYYAAWQRGEPLIIDGRCASACTTLLVFPNVCVTPRAKLGFHQAYYFAGIKIGSSWGTQFMMDRYPPRVRAWIKRKGGLPLYGMLWMSASEARKLGIRAC